MRRKKIAHRTVNKEEAKELSSPKMEYLKAKRVHMKSIVRKLKSNQELMDGLKSLNQLDYLYFKEKTRLEKGNQSRA